MANTNLSRFLLESNSDTDCLAGLLQLVETFAPADSLLKKALTNQVLGFKALTDKEEIQEATVILQEVCDEIQQLADKAETTRRLEALRSTEDEFAEFATGRV